MNCKKLLPFRKLEIDEGLDDLNSGIADEHVESAERLDHLRDAGVHLRLLADIHADRDRAGAGRIDLMRGGFGCLQVEIGDGEFGALSCENNGDFLAYTTGCTGDDNDFILEANGLSFLMPGF